MSPHMAFIQMPTAFIKIYPQPSEKNTIIMVLKTIRREAALFLLRGGDFLPPLFSVEFFRISLKTK